jgi:hypothetical protein
MKIPEEMQMDLNIVPTRMFWTKVQTTQGEFTVLHVTTTVGAWGFFMPPSMVTDLRKGMQDMESSIAVVHQMPTIRQPIDSGPNGMGR